MYISERGWNSQLWLVGIGLALFACAGSSRPEQTQPTIMDIDKALLLTKAWCDEVHESFTQVEIADNGDFRGVLGAPDIIYSAQEKRLTVLGLVINNASVMVELPEVFEDFEQVGKYEPYTLGEGYFYIEKTPMSQKKPQLTLRKDFTDGSISPVQFVKEVNWLMQWSTYWRKNRSLDVLGKPVEELVKKSPSIETKFRKATPRPR